MKNWLTGNFLKLLLLKQKEIPLLSIFSIFLDSNLNSESKLFAEPYWSLENSDQILFWYLSKQEKPKADV